MENDSSRILNIGISEAEWELAAIIRGGNFSIASEIRLGFDLPSEGNRAQSLLDIRIFFFSPESEAEFNGSMRLNLFAVYELDDRYAGKKFDDTDMQSLVRESLLVLSGLARQRIADVGKMAGMIAPLIIQFEDLEGKFISNTGYRTFEEIATLGNAKVSQE